MRAPAKIDKRTTAIYSALLAGNQLINIVQLVLAVREHFLQVLFRNLQPVKALFVLENSIGLAIDGRPIGFPNNTSAVALAHRNAFQINIPMDNAYPPGMAIS